MNTRQYSIMTVVAHRKILFNSIPCKTYFVVCTFTRHNQRLIFLLTAITEVIIPNTNWWEFFFLFVQERFYLIIIADITQNLLMLMSCFKIQESWWMILLIISKIKNKSIYLSACARSRYGSFWMLLASLR